MKDIAQNARTVWDHYQLGVMVGAHSLVGELCGYLLSSVRSGA